MWKKTIATTAVWSYNFHICVEFGYLRPSTYVRGAGSNLKVGERCRKKCFRVPPHISAVSPTSRALFAFVMGSDSSLWYLTFSEHRINCKIVNINIITRHCMIS